MQGKFGTVGMGIADDTDEEAFGEIRENIINQNRFYGTDDVVVPMHNSEKAIDFNTVDESQYPDLNPNKNEEDKEGDGSISKGPSTTL